MHKALGYQVVEGWEQLPAGFAHFDVPGVAVDSGDRVYVITREDARVIIYEPGGAFVRSWGEGTFIERVHGLCIGPDDSVYIVADGNHTIRKFTPDGEELMTIGVPGKCSDTGYDGRDVNSIKRSAGPFNHPTGVAVAKNGDIYISDGYGNARVHHFSPGGKLIRSWGTPGTGPGEFNLPHDVCVTEDGRVLIADRENDRIQVFTSEGEFVDLWTHVQRPTGLYCDRRNLIYVSSLWWQIGEESRVHGKIRHDLPGHISILDQEGNLLLRWISADRCAPGNFAAPHSICADSRGDIYVGEVTGAVGVSRKLVPPDCHTLQKFTRMAVFDLTESWRSDPPPAGARK